MQSLEHTLLSAAPAVDFWTARALRRRGESLVVRNGVCKTPTRFDDEGLMVCVAHRGGMAFAASPDLSPSGVAEAFAHARQMAEATAGQLVVRPELLPLPKAQASHESPSDPRLDQMGLRARIELLQEAQAAARRTPGIVASESGLTHWHAEQLFLSSHGARIEQVWHRTVPRLEVVAGEGGDTALRSLGGRYNGVCQLGGLDVLERARFLQRGAELAQEALELVRAPNCPSGEMDLVLMPDQMSLQIHESIGHPLELDRILGDERNFAGTSFVTLEMFGHFRYGSDLLNVSYDPSIEEQFASFAYDDEGALAEQQWLIREGLLLRPLGGSLSQARARAMGYDLGAVATTRASGWNRPPIDRMSNLNVHAGGSSLEDIIASTEHGILMETNTSWSIDDSRNKFQFGCERGRMIRGGQLAEVVKRPNYRGVSSQFWRSLSMVGDPSTFEVMGVPNCGKGEPSQVIEVGHASPVCKFGGVAVFGGA